MNIFDYLRDDEAYLERHLKQMIVHYSKWTPEQIFSESVKLLASISTHLDKKETLLSTHVSARDQQMLAILNEAARQRAEIDADIEDLTQIHVDETGYVAALESLLRKMINHRKYCEERFYPQVATRLSKGDRDAISADLEELVFS